MNEPADGIRTGESGLVSDDGGKELVRVIGTRNLDHLSGGKMRIIGLRGLKGSGKDTVARLLGAHLPLRRYAFADALKAEVAAVCGVQVPFVEENKARFRMMLQWWGTEFRRGFHGENYWVERMAARLREHPEHAVAVVTDVRFENEAALVTGLGGCVIEVMRPGSDATDAHASERAMDTWGGYAARIYNTGDLTHLNAGVRALAALLPKEWGFDQ